MDQYLALGVFALISFSVLCAPLLWALRSVDASQETDEIDGTSLSRERSFYTVLIVVFGLCHGTLLLLLPISCVFTLASWPTIMVLFMFTAAAWAHAGRRVLGAGR